MSASQSNVPVAPLKIACCQIAPEVGRKVSNLERTASFLPELCSSGYVFESRAEAMALSDAYEDGSTTALWSRLARDLDVHIVGGFAERYGDTLFNSSALIGPDGRMGLFRKVHLWANENLFFAPGNLGFPVFPTRHGTVAMAICYDGWFPEQLRTAGGGTCLRTN